MVADHNLVSGNPGAFDDRSPGGGATREPAGECSRAEGLSWKDEKISACEGCRVYLDSFQRERSVSIRDLDMFFTRRDASGVGRRCRGRATVKAKRTNNWTIIMVMKMRTRMSFL
jgi:hypothetical protein